MRERLTTGCIFMALFVAFANPVTLSLFDPNPPLSELVLYGLYSSYFMTTTLLFLYIIFGPQVLQIMVATVACFGAAELIARTLEISDTERITKFRTTQPEPYHNAEYFSPAFIHESINHPDGFFIDPSTKVLYPNDFDGAYFNIQNHLRRTTDQPEKATHTIYMFGGSTMYSSEVPDGYTIASYLQRLCNQDSVVKVVNFGVSASTSNLNFRRLQKDVKIKAGDFVIFYGGVNDVLFRLVYKNIDGYIYGRPENVPVIVSAINYLALKSAFARKAIEISQEGKSPLYTGEAVETAVKGYAAQISEVHSFVTKNRAHFLHFLQPNLVTKQNKNRYEQWLEKTRNVPSYVIPAFKLMYPEIREKFQSKPYSYDISGAFDKLKQSPYLDYSHVSHIGNKIIAETIHEKVCKKSRTVDQTKLW